MFLQPSFANAHHCGGCALADGENVGWRFAYPTYESILDNMKKDMYDKQGRFKEASNRGFFYGWNKSTKG